MKREDLERLVDQLSRYRGYIRSIHLAGGEPFLRFDLLREAVQLLTRASLPLAYVETNAYWATSERVARQKLSALKEAGLRGILVSVSPFHLEQIPFERTALAIRVAEEIFGSWGVYLFTPGFYHQFRMLNVRGTLPLEEYTKLVGEQQLARRVSTEYQFVPNGRGAFQLSHMFPKKSAKKFFSINCRASLAYPGHVHIDLYGNYIGGLCAGISVGNGFDLDRLYAEGTSLQDRPVLRQLVEGTLGSLYAWATEEYGFRELEEGYIAPCHLCAHIRKHIYDQGGRTPELAPPEFYNYLQAQPSLKKSAPKP